MQTHREYEKYIQIYARKILNGTGHLRYLGIKVSIILKYISRKCCDSVTFVWIKTEPVSEHM
jgi:hypothetical protein